MRRSLGVGLLRVVAAGLLGVDAYVHAADAMCYDSSGAGISIGLLFRAEAVAASLAAVVVLIGWHSRLSWLPALLVAASAFGAVVLYRYVDVGALGPLPNMYEPTWQVPGKLLSARCEGAATLVCAVGFALPGQGRRSRLAVDGAGEVRT